MFDLPVKTKAETSAANRFRNHLLDLGFCRAQFSVYVQYFPLSSRVAATVKQLKTQLPNGGDIRVLSVTDTQWSKMIRFSKGKVGSGDEPPSQLVIF
nr:MULTISPECIES: CRISPR-associated endonuclease Cas2 [Corynebacterium]